MVTNKKEVDSFKLFNDSGTKTMLSDLELDEMLFPVGIHITRPIYKSNFDLSVLNNAIIDDTIWESSLIGTKFNNTHWSKTKLSRCDFSGAKFYNCVFYNTVFHKCNLSLAIFFNCRGSVKVSKCNISSCLGLSELLGKGKSIIKWWPAANNKNPKKRSNKAVLLTSNEDLLL